MQLRFKNAELDKMINFIQSLTLSGAQANRGRFRLIKLLQAKTTELVDERMEIAKAYTKLDSDGNPVLHNFKFDVLPDKKNEFNKSQQELLTSDAEINVDEYKQSLSAFYTALNNYDEKIDGANVMMFGRLLDSMENSGFGVEE